MMQYRFGRLPHDPAALAAAPGLLAPRYASVVPLPTLDRRALPFSPRLCQNDALPVCAAAALVNAVLAVGAIGGFEPVVNEALALPFYAGVAGCAPTEAAIAATDGVTLLAALQRQAQAGFDVGQQVPLRAIAGTIPLTRAAIAHCMLNFAVCYVGVDLYERDMEMPPLWDDDGRDPGALVGGHCLDFWDYLGVADTDTGRAATWGAFQPFTWRWVRARCQEAHGLYWRQLAPAMSAAVDQDRLAAELAADT